MRRCLLLLLPLLACTPRREPGAGDEARPQVALSGVFLRVFEGGTLSAVGQAERVTYLRDSGDLVASHAWMRLVPREAAPGAPALPSARAGLEVRAGQVAGNVGARRALATGGVVLQGAGGLVARTEAARYDGAAQRLQGERPIHVVRPGSTVDAQGFDFDLAAEAYTFSGGVVTRLEAAR